MAYGSKTLSRKLAAIAEAASRAKNLAPAIAAAFDDLPPVLRPGETMPDFALLTTVVGRAFEELGSHMAELHQRHHHARAVEMHDRAALRAAAVALRGHLVQVRFVLDRSCGSSGIADFEGREDLQRIPMHSLERIAAGRLALFDDPRFGWGSYDRPDHLAWVRDELAARIAAFRAARDAASESRSRRLLAAGESQRRMREDEQRLGELYHLFESLLHLAGYPRIAATLRPKRPPASRRRGAPCESRHDALPLTPA
jgi:hypothetical protein